MGIKCPGRKCYWYSTLTRTCDFYLMNGIGHRRGCPASNCDKCRERVRGDKRVELRLPQSDGWALLRELDRESIWEADQLIRDYAKRHSD